MLTQTAPPNGIEIHPTAVVCREATIEGNVRVGPGTVIHPFAVIKATNGPIVIGDNNIIEERSLIQNVATEDGHVMNIGNDNIIEVGSVIQSLSVGNNNWLQMQCEVAPGTSIGSGCSIGPRCYLSATQKFPEMGVVYGKDNQQRVACEAPPGPQGLLEIFRRLLPSFHYLYKRKENA